MSVAIPLINIAPFRAGDRESSGAIVAAVKTACEEIGFFMIEGHGVPEDLVERTYESGVEFFDLPEREKQCFAKPSPQVNRGYTSMKGRTVGRVNNPALLPSLQEGYAMGMMEVPDDPYFRADAAATNFAPNIWPQIPATFQPTMRAYYCAMEQLSEVIMRLFAKALDLPEDFFSDKMDKHISTLRLVNYPALREDPRDGEERAGAHTDTGTLTILRIDDAPGGLQVQNRAGEWLDIKRPPGAFIINIGDMMMRWTNDHWISTVHRVVNPPAGADGSSRRLSIVYFSQPNYDTVVECISTCCNAENPARYAPITSGGHRLARYAQTYGFDLPNAARS